MTEHLRIEQEFREGRKTPLYNVWNVDGEFLGVLRWHGPWRQYVWDAEPGIIMSKGCDLEKWAKLDEFEKERKLLG